MNNEMHRERIPRVKDDILRYYQRVLPPAEVLEAHFGHWNIGKYIYVIG